MIIELAHADLREDPRLTDYTRLKDVKLRSRIEPERGLYMAESATVIERAIAAGHRPRSFLVSARWLPTLRPRRPDRSKAGRFPCSLRRKRSWNA